MSRPGYAKQWYQTNKKSVQKRNKLIRIRNKQYVLGYLASHFCVDCNESDPRVLDFDHVRGIKSTEISKLIIRGVSFQTLDKEIEKCDVRCANCHRRVTCVRRVFSNP